MILKIFSIFIVLSGTTGLDKVSRRNEASEGLQKLGWHLVRSAPVDENMVCSPFSMAGVLHMLAAGANGPTRAEILQHGLGLQYRKYVNRKNAFNYKLLVDSYQEFSDGILGDRKDKYDCKIFNGLYHQSDGGRAARKSAVNPEYARVLKKGWIRNLGEIKDLDFAHDVNGARDYINNKVNETTKGKIENLIQTLNEDTLLVVLSVIYLDAKWKKFPDYNKKPFVDIKSNLVEGDQELRFYQSLDREVFTPIETNSAQEVKWIKTSSGQYEHVGFYWDRENDINVIRLELESNKQSKSMFLNIFQPRAYMDQLKNWTWADFSATLDRAEISGGKLKGTLFLPTFSIEFAKNVNNWLELLGVRKVFNPVEADLTPMLPSNDEAFVSYIRHQATFALDYRGIIASAATVGAIDNKSGLMEKVMDHYINSPFYFSLTVTEKSIPIFMGKMVDPRRPK